MLKSTLQLGKALGLTLFALFILIEALGYITWQLMPRDPVALQRALGFEASITGLSRSPETIVPISARDDQGIPDRFPTHPKALHAVTEWSPERGRRFRQAPILDHKKLPPVEARLPENPLVIIPPEQNGPYGGVWQRYATGPGDIGIIKARLAYEGLVRWGPMAQRILPNLAVSWTIENAGRTFTFQLRRGVRWSDGHPFTADDILFWYEHVIQHPDLTPATPGVYMRGGVLMDVEKIDEYTIRFQFEQPHGLFLKALASGRGYDVVDYPAHYLKHFHPTFTSKETLDVMTQAAGFDFWYQLWGDKRDWRNMDLPRLWAWTIAEPPPAQPVVFVRNPYYWKVDPDGNQLPYIDRINVEIYDPETINLKAINGEIGMQSRHLQFGNYPLFMENRDKGGYRVLHWINGSGGSNILGINLNQKDPVLKSIVGDRRFRIALSHAMDRDVLNEAGFFGIGRPRQVSPPPSSPYYDPAYEQAYITYDPVIADSLLDAMGLKQKNEEGIRIRPDGQPVEFTIETTAFNSHLLELVAGYWTAVGVKTKVKELARQLFYQRKAALMHDVGVWGGADEQIPILDPRWFMPYSHESIQAIGYSRWFRTDGAKGEKPPEDIQQVMALYRQIEESMDESEQIRLFQNILDLNRKNLWVIGTVGGMPSLIVVKNTFRNVPEVALTGWSFRSPGNTAVECYAIEAID